MRIKIVSFILALGASLPLGIHADKVTCKKDSVRPTTSCLVFSEPESMPKFPGGEKALMEFITANLQYPKEAMEKNISGRVIVTFIVSAKGKVESPKIIRGIDPSCDKEALRLTSILPDFKPATYYGKLKAVKYILPITFRSTAKPKGSK